MPNHEAELIAEADRRARHYLESLSERPVFPSEEAIESLSAFEEEISELGTPPEETLRLLDEVGTPATVTSNGPR